MRDSFVIIISFSIAFSSIEVFIHFNFRKLVQMWSHQITIFHLHPQQLAIKQNRNIMVLNIYIQYIEASYAH